MIIPVISVALSFSLSLSSNSFKLISLTISALFFWDLGIIMTCCTGFVKMFNNFLDFFLLVLELDLNTKIKNIKLESNIK